MQEEKYKNIIVSLMVTILLLIAMVVDKQCKIDKLRHQIQIEHSVYFDKNLYI